MSLDHPLGRKEGLDLFTQKRNAFGLLEDDIRIATEEKNARGEREIDSPSSILDAWRQIRGIEGEDERTSGNCLVCSAARHISANEP